MDVQTSSALAAQYQRGREMLGVLQVRATVDGMRANGELVPPHLDDASPAADLMPVVDAAALEAWADTCTDLLAAIPAPESVEAFTAARLDPDEIAALTEQLRIIGSVPSG